MHNGSTSETFGPLTVQDELDLRVFRGFKREMVADFSHMEKSVLLYLVQGYSLQSIAGRLDCEARTIYAITRQLRYRFSTRTLAGIVSHAIGLGVITPDGTLIVQSDT